MEYRERVVVNAERVCKSGVFIAKPPIVRVRVVQDRTVGFRKEGNLVVVVTMSLVIMTLMVMKVVVVICSGAWSHGSSS